MLTRFESSIILEGFLVQTMAWVYLKLKSNFVKTKTEDRGRMMKEGEWTRKRRFFFSYNFIYTSSEETLSVN